MGTKLEENVVIKALTKAGLIPENCKRIVIDAAVGCLTTVYYETFASKEMMIVTAEALMQNKKSIEVVEVV